MNTKLEKKSELVKRDKAQNNLCTLAPVLPPLTEEQISSLEQFRGLDGFYEEGSQLLCAKKALKAAIDELKTSPDFPEIMMDDLTGLYDVLEAIAVNSTKEAGEKYTSENPDAYKKIFSKKFL